MDICHFIGSAVCHQIAERSFILAGKTLPVCARCTGIYTGIFFAMLFFILRGRLQGNRPYSAGCAVLAGLCFLPISIDGFFSYLGFWESNPFLRVVTGALAGGALPGFLLLGANFEPTGKNDSPVINGIAEQLAILGVTLLWGLMVWQGKMFYAPAAGILSMGVLCFWALFFYLLMKNLAGKKKIPVWLLAFCCSFLIILFIGVMQR